MSPNLKVKIKLHVKFVYKGFLLYWPYFVHIRKDPIHAFCDPDDLQGPFKPTAT